MPEGLGALRSPSPNGKGPTGAREPALCQPQASHSASVIFFPLSPMMLLLVAMVTSLQDEILVSTRTGGGEGVLACAVTGSLAGDGDLHGAEGTL